MSCICIHGLHAVGYIIPLVMQAAHINNQLPFAASSVVYNGRKEIIPFGSPSLIPVLHIILLYFS